MEKERRSPDTNVESKSLKEILQLLRERNTNAHYERFSPSDTYSEITSPEEAENHQLMLSRNRSLNTIEDAWKAGELPRLINWVDPNNRDPFVRRPLTQDSFENIKETVIHLAQLIEAQREKEREIQIEIQKKLNTLADELLQNSVKHNETWQRTILPIPHENTKQIYNTFLNSGLDYLLTNHEFPDYENITHGYPGIKKNFLPKEQPDGIYIQAESFDYRKLYPDISDIKKDLEIGFIYVNNEQKEMDTIAVSIHVGDPGIASHVTSTEFAETGYEGHSFRSFEPPVSDIEKLYGIIDIFRKGLTNTDIPMEDRFAQMVFVNEQTGQKRYYDKEAKDWLPKEEEIFSPESEAELNKNNRLYPNIVIRNTYRIETLTDENTPPLRPDSQRLGKDPQSDNCIRNHK
jgi:hypothetical protein